MTKEYTRRPDLYDLEHPSDVQAGEIDFYRKLALEAGGPVLELGFGTGRVGIELARAGVEVTGLDLSEPMLARAREKLAAESPDVARRVTLVRGDMGSFELEREFRLVYVPFRAYLHLLTEADQRNALRRVARHLHRGGRFAGNFFRPKPSLLEGFPEEKLEITRNSGDGRTYVRSYWCPSVDLHAQVKDIVFHTRIYAPDGRLEEDRLDNLSLAWIHGREWKLMLELEGFELERLDGGFHGESPNEGWEYVWVARRTERQE